MTAPPTYRDDLLAVERITVRQNPRTGAWRVYIGQRIAYYCLNWIDAMQRANQLAEQQRDKRAELLADLEQERFGLP